MANEILRIDADWKTTNKIVSFVKLYIVNIPAVKNYPHKLKSVAAAINVLFAHERGWIAYNKNKE